jgi:hypothetical protein
VPAGANGQIQFNSNGVLGASPNFVWDNINNILDLTSSLELITTGGQNNIFSVAVDGQGNPLTTMKSSTATAYLIIDQGQPGGGGGIIFNTNGVYNGEISSWTAGGFQLFAPNRQQAIAVTATGNVGIGGVTNLPAAALNSPVTVVANMSTTGSALHINRYTNDTIAPGLYSYKARGTTSAPTPIQSGDWLGFLGWGGLLSSATAVDGAEINIITTTVTATGIAADVQFTVNDGTTANGTERLRLTHDGRVLITGTLWVNGVQVTVP